MLRRLIRATSAGLLLVLAAGCQDFRTPVQATPAGPSSPVAGTTGGSPVVATAPSATPSPWFPRLPAPESGRRWGSMLDAVVQVPADWGYADVPRCGTPATAFPSQPYVALSTLGRAVPAVGCTTPVGASREVEHLA